MDTIGSTKKLSDYLHLYLGCEAIETLHDHKCIIHEVRKDGKCYVLGDALFSDLLDVNYIKPILRPLSDMTEEERREMMREKHQYDTGNPRSHELTNHARRILWAISKHFDLFGLIESGLAIDSTTLEPSKQ